MPTMIKRKVNVHVSDPINCRREIVEDVTRTKNVDSVTHRLKPDETKATTNTWAVGSNLP